MPKPKILVDGTGDAITGLLFREPRPSEKSSSSSKASSTSETYLFISTLSKILVHPLSKAKRSGVGFPSLSGGSDVKVLDETVGAGLGCTTGVVLPLTDKELGFAVAREEGGIVVYTPAGRGPSFALPSTYSALSSLLPLPSSTSNSPYSGSVVVLSPPFAPTASAPSGTVRQMAKQGEKDMGRMTVLDLEVGWISWRNSFRGGGVWGVWRLGRGGLAVGSKDGKVRFPHPFAFLYPLPTRSDPPVSSFPYLAFVQRSSFSSLRLSPKSSRRSTQSPSSRSLSKWPSLAGPPRRAWRTFTVGMETGCTRRVIGRVRSVSTSRRSEEECRGAM